MLAQDRAMIEQLQRRQPRESVRKKPPTPPKVEGETIFTSTPKQISDRLATHIFETYLGLQGCSHGFLAVYWLSFSSATQTFSSKCFQPLLQSTTFVLPVEYQPLESATLADVWFLTPQVSPYKFRLDTAPPSPSNESDQAQGFNSWMGVLGQDIHGYSRKVQQRNIWKMRPQL